MARLLLSLLLISSLAVAQNTAEAQRRALEAQIIDFVSIFLRENYQQGHDNLGLYCLGSAQAKTGSDLSAVTYYTQVKVERLGKTSHRATAVVSSRLAGGQAVNGLWTFSVSVGTAATSTPYGLCMKKVSSAE
ncbi:MAG: hypothetical protein C4332_13290 [Meiothermus sp.]